MRQFSILFLLFVSGVTHAQETCKTFSLREAYEMTKVLNYSTEVLAYKNYPAFNFKNFKPVDGPLIESDFLKVGFDKKNEVREIIYYNKNDSLKNYRMFVFNYEDRRILTLGTAGPVGKYYYWPLAFIMDKRNNFNYLIGTSGIFKHFYEGKIWIEDFARMSSVMILDENLLPTDLIKMRDGQVVFYSELKCQRGQVTDEYVHLYYLQYDHEDLKIDFSTCPEILKRKCRYETPDLSFHVCPSVAQNGSLLIWLYLLRDTER